MTYELTHAQRAAMDPEVLELIDHQLRLQAWHESAATPDLSAPAAPPEGLSAVERMKWARQHGQVVPEFQLPEQSSPTVVPADVLALKPTDRMRWARRNSRQGV